MLTDLFAVKMYKNTKNDKKIDIIYKFLVTFPAFYGTLTWYIKNVGGDSKMSKKKEKG